MSGHESGRHTGWQSHAGGQPDPLQVSGDNEFDQWLNHLTQSWTDPLADPASDPTAGPASDPTADSGKQGWANPASAGGSFTGSPHPAPHSVTARDVSPMPQVGVRLEEQAHGGRMPYERRDPGRPLSAPVAFDPQPYTRSTNPDSFGTTEILGSRDTNRDARQHVDTDESPEGSTQYVVWDGHLIGEPGDLGGIASEHAGEGGARRGFLGSGWSGDSEDEEPESSRRRSRRVPILSAVCALIVVGITFAGFRLVGDQTSLTIEPPGTGCSSTGSCAAAPAGDLVTPTTPSDDFPVVPDGEAGAGSDTDPSPTPTPTPTPKATKSARLVVTPKPEPAAKKARAASKKQPAAFGDDEATFDEDADSENSEPPADEPVEDQDNLGVAAAARVAVDFQVLRQDSIGYSARIVVRNDGEDLSGWTLEIPVGGQVTSVDAARWEQRGGSLIITADEPLSAGDELTITFDADGAPEPPSECVLDQGDCGVSS